MKYRVFSGLLSQLEAGYPPHLEGVFKTLKEAEMYAETWRALYSGDHDFWVVDS
jgi:hypothetical protein